MGIICRSKHHVTNVPNHPARCHITESLIVNKALGHTRRSRPSRDGHRRTLMDHVDVKLVVTRDFEEDHLAIVRERPIQRETSDRDFQGRDIGRP